jgi:hypothetical protein
VCERVLSMSSQVRRKQGALNTLPLGNKEKPGHWQCPIKNGDEVGDCSFTDGQATNSEEKLAPIIAKALTMDESCMDDWVEVVKQ